MAFTVGEEPADIKTVSKRMKTIGTPGSVGSKAEPELIEDKAQPKATGRAVGELVSGKPAGNHEHHAREEAHWRENHAKQSFSQGRHFDEFHSAYRAGYEGYSEFGGNGKKFDETETKLRERYESENGSPKLDWTLARPAVHAAWHRAAAKKNG